MNNIRLGLVGCGNMAGSHLSGLERIDNLKITATCDIIEERAKKAAEYVGAEVVVTDYKKMVDAVDAVLVSLPHDLHFECGMYFLESGKHVLMEKPLCNTEKECMEIIKKAEQVEKVLMVAYPVRYWPVIVKMKELVDKKVYGDVFQMSIWTEQMTKYPEGHWATSAKRLGGGQFFSHGCHYIDLLLWFLDKPIKGIHMGTNMGTPWMEKEGTSNAVIEFESGALGYHFGTWGARGTRLGYSIHIHCTEGMLEYNLKEEKLYLHSDIHKEESDLEVRSSTKVLMENIKREKQTQHEIKHFIECIIEDKEPLTDGRSSLKGLRAIWKMYEAEEKGFIADLSG